MSETDEPEGVRERRRLMTEGEPEQAAVAAFELGVYYMNSPDGMVEAESCFRQAIARDHPAVTPGAQLNLAGLLLRTGRLEEAEAAYRAVIALQDPTTVIMATYGIGVLLATQPGRAGEAEIALRQAADSGDGEYGPIASHDLGVMLMQQPGRIPDAMRALARAAQSGHQEYAPRAWFNIAVVFSQSGGESEAESAYRQVIASGHPEIAPMAAVNLGALLGQHADRIADAEAAYQLAISFNHPEQSPMATLNLGNLLAGIPERRADAEASYRAAMASGHAIVATTAAYNLGNLLIGDPSRRRDAEAAFRTAADSHDPEQSPKALYNLGRLIAENPNRWDDAREALELAMSTGDEQVKGAAANLIGQLDESRFAERLIPALDETWRCIRSASQGQFYIEEYLPQEQTTANWSAIVTATQIARPGLTPRAYMDIIKQDFERSVVDGRLSWEILEHTEDEMIYESTIRDDVAAMDQDELSRIVRRNERLFTIQHAVRGDLISAARERPWRLELLRSAVFKHRPSPAAVTAPTVDDSEAAAILERATTPPDMSVPERLALYRQDLERITKDSYPAHWAALNFEIAALLMQQPHDESSDDADLDEAAASLRRALEIYRADSKPELRCLVLAHLGHIAFERARRHGRSDDPVAKEAVQNSLRHAIAAFDKSRAAFKPGSFEWTRSTVDLGDVRLSVDRDAAGATYEEAIERLENTPPEPEAERRMELAMLMMRAIVGIQRLDLLKSGEPIVPEGALDKEKRGKLLYLRPLLTAGSLRMVNRCVPGTFKVGFAREPDEITLESLLYRALAIDLNFMTLGGRPEGYGGTRFSMAAGGTDWKSMLPQLEEFADLVLMVPHKSEGVRWELDYLVERKALGRTLFIMPPSSIDVDVETMWKEGAVLMGKHGLRFPDYDSRGAICRFGPDGAVAEQWDFDYLWENRLLAAIDHLLPGGVRL